jgi:exopolysaccharide biosynthesis predicted pyruvyltransferase EpsI
MTFANGDSPLDQVLASLVGEEVFYQPNPGNAGDALIALGAYRAMERAGIPVRLFPRDAGGAKGRVVLYAGGGNLVGLYPACRDFFREHHARAKRLILLPHTIAGNEDLLGALGPNVTLICRDPVSFEHTRRHANRSEVLLDHDLALGLDAADVLSWSPSLRVRVDPESRPWATPLRAWMADRRNRARFRWRVVTRETTGNAFREDREARWDPPSGNVDLSVEMNLSPTKYPGVAALISRSFLASIGELPRVRTNRLHVAIGAGLLGKSVEFFPNSYFKNEAIFRFSLEASFPSVRWMGDARPA